MARTHSTTKMATNDHTFESFDSPLPFATYTYNAYNMSTFHRKK